MKKSAKSKDGRKAARGQLWLHLPGMVREALYDTVIGAGLACVDEVLETERGRYAESATSICPIARRCERDTWRARWSWVDGGSRCSGRGAGPSGPADRGLPGFRAAPAGRAAAR
jgi:hypothetical protein